ncbi:peptidoglycan lytic exotransglycosylase [Roseibium aquae]|uniref:Peptidoglycan lytic exotransglycosylase n=1 Tax=Roseibium aquae TaxID=1323746 RepID=A0A916X2A6_9HYPH|nr:lytic transglycosylase F [Roseibium aquae]GGB50795.1 peptidoglycan lytic exotransglycosylase [Roseibium aquae]
MSRPNPLLNIRPPIALTRSAVVLGLMVALLASLIIPPAPARAMEPGMADTLEEILREPFTGDFDAIAERGYLRVLVPFSKTFFFIDNGVQRGTAVDTMSEFGKFLDKRHGKKTREDQLVLIPTPRERIFQDLSEGRGDMAIGNLTVTKARAELVAFSTPTFDHVKEVLLTADSVPDIAAPEDLSGMEIHVRASSSYHDSLLALNKKLEAGGKAPVKIVKASENLEDEDLMDLVQAGGIPAIIVDDHKADLWLQILTGLKTHPDAAVRTGGQIAFAVRKDAPELLKEVNAFAQTVKKGTLLGNIILKRYLSDARYLENLSEDGRSAKFEDLSSLFQKYGAQYSIDWLLIAAQSYQESQFQQDVKSGAGAVGLMQIKPSTAEGSPIEIKGVAQDPEANVHAGVKYLRYIANTYFDDLKDNPANQTFFALAAYNAGPSRFARLRAEAASKGYDPDKWFGNVEWIVGHKISREPVRYVGNIYKYYVVFNAEAQHRAGKSGPAQ